MHRTLAAAASAAVLAVIAAAPASAQGGFGRHVAAADGAVFVSEPSNIVRSGLVYVYRPGADGNLSEVAQLRGPNSEGGDGFGAALAADGATLLVSRVSENESRGAVYVFELRGQTWEQTGVIAPADRAAGDSLGASVAVAGDVAVIGAPGAGDAGAVYIFRRNGSNWTQQSKLTGSDAAAGDRYAASVAVSGARLVVGAPGQESNRGAAYLYARADDGTWSEQAKLVSRTVSEGSLLGASVALAGGMAVVSAPGRDEDTGAVYVFEPNRQPGQQGWAAYTRLFPWDASSNSSFGVSLNVVDSELWVGSPGADGFSGAIYRFAHDETIDDLVTADKLMPPRNEEGQPVAFGAGFSSAFDVEGDLAVAGLPGMNSGDGGAVFFRRNASGAWVPAGIVEAEPETFPAVTGGIVECSSGEAGLFECGGDVQLLSFLPIPDIGGERGVGLNDIWGWTDETTGREYALVGRTNGTSFVDVTDASNPRYLGDLPMTEGSRANAWRDIKVYRDHAYVVADGAGAHGMQVFDLTRLRDVTTPQTFTADTVYNQIFSAHNIVINEESGFAFAVGSNSGGEVCGGGLHMIDIRDPKAPKFAGCFADTQTGIAGTGYSHDAQCVTYSGPDADYRGREICFGSNENALSIADVTNKDSTVALSSASYPNVAYAHQGWLTDDQAYFYMNDEGDEASGTTERTRTLIWDVSDLDDPQFLGEYLGETGAIDHNLYVKGDTMYESNYVSGLRIIDISDRQNPKEIGYFDSVPKSPNNAVFNGSWSNYPYFRSGTIVFTSIREGLFVVRVRRPIS